MLKCKITKLSETIWPLILSDTPIMTYGATGIGKSSVIRHELMPMIERQYGPSVLHDIRLSTKDIVDGTGMPIIDKDQMATFWTRPAFIPVDDGKMHIFFYDEFGHASVQLQQMAYSLVLDRALGGYRLPVNNRILLATNTRTDGGGDNKMLKPLENRMAHVTAENDAPGLIEKMKLWGWDSRLVAFLSLRPTQIHAVSQTDPAFPTPRSLESLSKTLRALPPDVKSATVDNVSQMICGEGFTREFMTFLSNIAANLPKIPDILSNPDKASVPLDNHYQYVVGAAVSKNIDSKTATKFATYLARLTPDIASMAAHAAIARDASLGSNSALKALIVEEGSK